MTDVCAALPAAGLVSSMTGYLDCQAQLLGSGAWSALAAPGSTAAIVLKGLLTIFIALTGYNLLLGSTLTVRESTLAFIKIGAVFALATSWPAYRIVVYDVVTDGPSQLVGEIGPPTGVAGADGSLRSRLDLADQGLAQLAALGPGNPPVSADLQTVPPPFNGFDAFALGGSRILFLLTAIASLGVVRILTGLMLALGPFFIGFFLFDGTRGLFEGWVRVLAGAALAAFGVRVALGLELAMIQPWLSEILARRLSGEALPNMPAELFVIVAVCTIMVVAALCACARVARAFRLRSPQQVIASSNAPRILVQSRTDANRSSGTGGAGRSRAAAISSAAAAVSRREIANRDPQPRIAFLAGRPSGVRRSSDRAPSVVPVGHSFTRRAASRVSARATQRDAQ